MATVEKTIVIKTDTKSSQKEVKELEKAVEGVNKEVKETSASTEAMGGVLDSVTGGAVSKFNGLKGSLKGVITSFKTLRVAIISTGIGALVIGVLALAAAFKGSEEGQNKFSKIMTVIGAAVGNLVDLLADLGENIISAFENPKQALKDFTKLIKENIVNRFEGLLELFPKLGKAISLLFKGEFSAAGKVAADAVGKVTLGVDSITDSVARATEGVKGFIKEQEKELKQAAAVADMRAKADKIERKLIVDRSKLESEIANLRLKSRQEEEFSAAERKQALLDAQVLEDQLLDKETQFLELRRDAQVLENTFSRSNKENLTKEAEAIAAVNRQQAARANTARQVQREVNTISKQIEAENKRLANEQKAIENQKIEEQKLRDAAEIERLKVLAEEKKKIKEKELADTKAVADAELDIKNAAAAASTFAFNLLASTDKKNKKLQAAMLIATNAVGIAQNIINTNAANARLTLEAGIAAPPLILANKIRMFTGIAASVAATAKGLSALKTGGSASGGGGASAAGGGGETQPPSFNIVGASDTNQLADAIGGQTQQPVQAFVVANDVTTAQSLENNIVEGATL